MLVRILVETDAPAWWQLRLEALQREPLAFGMSVEEHEVFAVEAVAARFRDTAGGNFTLGAFEDDKLIGMMTFVRETQIKSRHKGHIYGVYVSPDARQKGVGRALLATLLERAAQDVSLEQIVLAVGASQIAAQRLYSGHGFKAYGTELKALKVGCAYVDEIHMALEIR